MKIQLNAVYRHYKGNYYRTLMIATDVCNYNRQVIIYYRCDINGIFKVMFDNEIRVVQPFSKTVYDFTANVFDTNIARYTFIKSLDR